MSTSIHDFDLRPSLQLVRAVPVAPPRRRPPSPPMWIDGDPRANEVLHVYERTGGLWSSDEVSLMLRRRTAHPVSLLARWIVDTLVISLAWRGDYLLPAFQFDVGHATVRRPVFAVLEALDGTFKDLDLASWFALPNAHLDDAAPVDVIELDPDAVLEAAHAERAGALRLHRSSPITLPSTR